MTIIPVMIKKCNDYNYNKFNKLDLKGHSQRSERLTELVWIPITAQNAWIGTHFRALLSCQEFF